MSIRVIQYGINGKEIESLADFFQQIAGHLPMPAHFGHNLDALWDVLTTDLPGPCELVWHDSEHSRAAMEKDFDRLVELLQEVALERDDFRLILR